MTHPGFIRRELERAAARVLFGLPPGVQVALAGGSSIRVDGQTLHPQLQLMLALRKRQSTQASLRATSVQQARAGMLRDAKTFAGPPVPVARVTDLWIEGARTPLRARHYVPHAEPGLRPLLVFLHGGGFVLGDLDTHDPPCRLLCREAGVHVLAVDYRLAPEHPFPAAVEDAVAALQWAQRNAGRIGADPRRIAIGGDSAGGNLSAVATQLTAQAGGPAPALQLLMYPVTDRVRPRPSWRHFERDFYLTSDDMAWFDELYLGPDPALRADPRFSPLAAPRLSGQCPALLITAGFDPLRDEGEAYANALAAAGADVSWWREPQLLHGFINMAGISPAARAALVKIARRLRSILDAPVRADLATKQWPADRASA